LGQVIRDLSIRAKVLVTILGALAVSLAVAVYFSLRYWQREQVALTTGHALMVAASARASVEASLAHGQVSIVREALQQYLGRPPVTAWRVVGRDGTILMSSRPEEEGRHHPGAALPDPWDIPSEGRVVGRPGSPELGVVVPLSGVGAPGGRGLLELLLGGGPLEQAVRRGYGFGLTLAVLLAVAYAVAMGAMMEREVIGPFRRLERLAASQQAQLTERAGFAEVGALTSEVAHEIKRPLAGIRGAIELIEHEYAMSDAQRRLLTQVEDELAHVDETLRDLLSLAKPVGIAHEPVPVNEMIDGALARLSGVPGSERVTVERRYEPALPSVPGDRLRLEQAVLNLCVNAVEAMPQGGRLTVTTRAQDGAVAIDVADTGSGIPRENLDRIMKPFFSTKPHGTGLGLPLVARVVHTHGGKVSVHSEAGRGTTFRVELPLRNGLWPANAS
jgi:signal transduction histidine kinase